MLSQDVSQLGIDAAEDAAHETDMADRFRGGDDEDPDDIEDLRLAVGGDEAEFMQTHGVGFSHDEAVHDEGDSDDEDDSISTIEDNLDKPAHDQTQWTVRQTIYSLLRSSAGRVNKQVVDEFIQIFVNVLPQGHRLPRHDLCGRPASYHGHQRGLYAVLAMLCRPLSACGTPCGPTHTAPL